MDLRQLYLVVFHMYVWVTSEKLNIALFAFWLLFEHQVFFRVQVNTIEAHWPTFASFYFVSQYMHYKGPVMELKPKQILVTNLHKSRIYLL